MRENTSAKNLLESVEAAQEAAKQILAEVGAPFRSTNPAPYLQLTDASLAFDNHDDAPPWGGEFDDSGGVG